MTDFTDRLSANLWKIVAVVLAASFVLMMLAFRSVVVPVKAALVNLLSIGAAYGVITMAFQTDRGAHLLGLPDAVPIAPYVPVLMFAILFGLSMDYEVFLLSRVREEYLRTGDSKGSVVAGLSSTARVITSAALIMVAVFLGFALDPAVAIKMIGIGLATAIAIDATVVRLVLVPATMALLGARNWYLPAWLDRVLPNVDPHGTVPTGSAVPAAPRDPGAAPGAGARLADRGGPADAERDRGQRGVDTGREPVDHPQPHGREQPAQAAPASAQHESRAAASAMNSSPNTSSWAHSGPPSGLTNCGRKAR